MQLADPALVPGAAGSVVLIPGGLVGRSLRNADRSVFVVGRRIELFTSGCWLSSGSPA